MRGGRALRGVRPDVVARRLCIDDVVAPVDEAIAATRSSPEHGPSQAADRVTVKTALERLAADEREVLELAYYAGLTQTEIARHLQAPLGTVKTRMRRGLERLQAMIGKRPT